MATKEIAVGISPEELERKMRAVDHGIAQQTLEGLTVPEATVKDLRRAARGEISNDQVLSNIYARLPNVSIFRP